jgi:hypothetical protein
MRRVLGYENRPSTTEYVINMRSPFELAVSTGRAIPTNPTDAPFRVHDDDRLSGRSRRKPTGSADRTGKYVL